MDEAGTIRPPYLPDLSSWSAARGVTLLSAAQSVAQLRRAYGYDGADALLANLPAVVH